MAYSEALLDHFRNPRHTGSLEGADAVGRAGVPGQGPHLVLFLKTEGERITEARFQTYGCPAAIASGSFLSEWARGKTLGEAAAMEPEALAEGLGGVPLGKEHCPRLAVEALRDALGQLKATGREGP